MTDRHMPTLCNKKTVMGHIRYTLRYPTLFIRMLHLIEAVERTAKTSLSRLAMSVVICFDFSEKIKTLSEKISKEKTTPEDRHIDIIRQNKN